MAFHQLLLAWPDQLLAGNPSHPSDSSEAIAIQLRLGRLSQAQAHLLEALARKPDSLPHLFLLGVLRLQQGHPSEVKPILDRLYKHSPAALETRTLFVQACLQKGDLLSIDQAGLALWQGEESSPLLALARIGLAIKRKNLPEAQHRLAALCSSPSLEALQLEARCLSLQGNHRDALALLHPALKRAPQHLGLMVQLLELVVDAREPSLVLPIARHALAASGEHPDLLWHVTTVKLYQRQPGLARRSALMQSAWSSVRPTPINTANQVCCYEQTGQGDWLEWLEPSLLEQPLRNLLMSSNLAMQLSSIESAHYPRLVNTMLAAITPTREYAAHRAAGGGVPRLQPANGRPLRIAWITGDLAPHPVSRFLLGFLEASNGRRQHHHQLVSVNDHGSESNAHLFANLPGVTIEHVSRYQDHDRVAAIRALQADLAIDLSGWTGGHFMAGFMVRVAPVQVNYLGFHATSGVPQMDVWLGDRELFPSELSEWHTEAIWRLDRPFLAWQPAAALPEAKAAVAEAPSGPVRFGSFNHNRKLSDATLRLWGELLASVPGARLVLKASAQDDPATKELLRRRMLRAGLEPERVDWLPLTPTPEDHLAQYRHVDIALDPMPNGGCTTTCEALWMGVPVITLEGRSYVSRMSTAVLRGAGLPDWVCPSPAAYLSLAQAQALQLQQLRSSRDHWRRQLVASPLGDAADLMQHLEQAFSAMHAQALKALAPPA